MTTYGLATKQEIIEAYMALGDDEAVRLLGSAPAAEDFAAYMLNNNLVFAVVCDGKAGVLLWLYDFFPGGAWISYFFTGAGNKRQIYLAIRQVVNTMVNTGMILRGEIRKDNRVAAKIAQACGFEVYRECGDVVYVQTKKGEQKNG